MHDAVNYFVLKDPLLDLWELKDDWDQSGEVAFGVDWNAVAVLQTAEGNVYDVLVEQQVLRLFICEDHHERLNQCISELVVRLLSFGQALDLLVEEGMVSLLKQIGRLLAELQRQNRRLVHDDGTVISIRSLSLDQTTLWGLLRQHLARLARGFTGLLDASQLNEGLYAFTLFKMVYHRYSLFHNGFFALLCQVSIFLLIINRDSVLKSFRHYFHVQRDIQLSFEL